MKTARELPLARSFGLTDGSLCHTQHDVCPKSWSDLMLCVCQTPDASEKEIKQAYYRVMRACHPDVVSVEGEDDESSAEEVCVFVNDIYEVCS